MEEIRNLLQGLENLSVQQFLEFKLKDLNSKKFEIDLEIKRIEKILEIGIYKKKEVIFLEDKKTTVMVSLNQVKDSLLLYAKDKGDYFTLREVKEMFFPEQYKNKNTRKRLNVAFHAILFDLKSKKLVNLKANPNSAGNEKLYLIKQEALNNIV